MRATTMRRIGLGALAVLPLWVERVSAQVGPAPTAVPTTPVAPPTSGEAAGAALFVVLMIVLFAIIGIGVKLHDLSRKRSEQALLLQARIAEALMLDSSLAKLPVAATADAPLWRGSPVRIEVTGQVPSRWLREAVMSMITAEASRVGGEYHIEDRLMVVPEMIRRVA